MPPFNPIFAFIFFHLKLIILSLFPGQKKILEWLKR